MTPENLPVNNSCEKSARLIEKLEGHFITPKSESTNEIASYIKKEYLCVLDFSHSSLADIIAVSLVTDEIVKKVNNPNLLKGFNFPYISSLDKQVPGIEMKGFMSTLKEKCHQKGTFLTPIMRPKDLQLELAEAEDKKAVIKKAKLMKKNFLEKVKDKTCAFAIFGEGTVESGRINPQTGEVNGLRFLESKGVLDGFLEENKNENIVVFGVAINGAHNLFSPDTYQINFNSPKIEIKITEPLFNQDFENLDGQIPSNVVLGKINNLLSIENQNKKSNFVSQSTRVDLK